MVWNEDGKEEQPMMDAVTLAEISDRIQIAIRFHQEMKITSWNLNHTESMTGGIYLLKETDEYFQMITSDGDISKIYFDEIMEAEILET
ncbi:YolD-like family protein [Lederbergia citrea]|uniref:YolD-like family protein n=1 Tax=Lederbergia citrea TaxID=2833581 RepID=A0A942Z4F8_9BACI|nr:YolD-like family protein [Lederbergia citrea]MBS4221746.1 YolD-like family protein [Lederbergia citrea]